MKGLRKFFKGLVAGIIYFITGLFFFIIFCIGLVTYLKLAPKLENDEVLCSLLSIVAILGAGGLIAIGNFIFEKISDCRFLDSRC